jgi:hypothetical protein
VVRPLELNDEFVFPDRACPNVPYLSNFTHSGDAFTLVIQEVFGKKVAVMDPSDLSLDVPRFTH